VTPLGFTVAGGAFTVTLSVALTFTLACSLALAFTIALLLSFEFAILLAEELESLLFTLLFGELLLTALDG
jgi:hypothetical protein